MSRTSRLKISGTGRVVVGRDVVIGEGARIVVRDSTLHIGDRTFIGRHSTLIAFSDLRIAEDVLLGQNVSVHTENHGPAGDRDNFTSAPIEIAQQAWLGAGVVVTSGVTIGVGVTVGANAVVTRDIPAGATAVGIPARVRNLS